MLLSGKVFASYIRLQKSDFYFNFLYKFILIMIYIYIYNDHLQ